MNFTLYFELYGHKMKAQIEADSPDLAVRKLKDKIIIHKIVRNGDDSTGVEFLKNLFGMK